MLNIFNLTLTVPHSSSFYLASQFQSVPKPVDSCFASAVLFITTLPPYTFHSLTCIKNNFLIPNLQWYDSNYFYTLFLSFYIILSDFQESIIQIDFTSLAKKNSSKELHITTVGRGPGGPWNHLLTEGEGKVMELKPSNRKPKAVNRTQWGGDLTNLFMQTATNSLSF